MALSPGTRLGPYEILSPIGAGGMGEVYRARDMRLHRDVAIKISNEKFSDRFVHEARSIAALNHTNACHLYDVGPDYLVLELVEGETLHGPMSFEKALPIIRQLVDGIEAAHDHNIVHRDLKPANIKVTPDDIVKILDFGLAKASASETEGDPEVSPTQTIGPTEAGTILGTAAYMSPEQARGKTADKRSDIWSFGVVVYELLTGKKPFWGESVVEILGEVINKDPDWSAVPARARPLLEWCLEKDRKKRLQSIGDARRLLDQPVAQPTIAKSHSWIPWTIAAALILALVAGWFSVMFLPRKSPPRGRVTFTIDPPPGKIIHDAAVSPDGTRVAIVAGTGPSDARLWIRNLDDLALQPVAGSDGASDFLWSPNGYKLALVIGREIRVVDLSTGSTQTLSSAEHVGLTEWGDNGTILFHASGPIGQSRIFQIPATGGSPKAIFPLDAGRKEVGQDHPIFLPGGRRILYFSQAATTPGVYAASLDGAERKFITSNSDGHFLRDPGSGKSYLCSCNSTGCQVQPFDLDSLRLTGDPYVVPHVGFRQLRSINDSGLAYIPSSDVRFKLFWYSRDGKELEAVAGPERFNGYELSPDNRKVALEVLTGPRGFGDIWIQDLQRGSKQRLTSDPGWEYTQRFWPDGSKIAFMWYRDEPRRFQIAIKPANGAGAEDLIFDSPVRSFLDDISSNGAFLLHSRDGPPSTLWLLPMADRKPVLFRSSTGDSHEGRFSPDGRWIAYTSTDSGSPEIEVLDFSPQAAAAPQTKGELTVVSTGGGSYPRWSRDGKELFYLTADSTLMTVPVTIGAHFTAGKPQKLFRLPVAGAPFYRIPYAVSSDSRRFLVAVPEGSETNHLVVVTNWMESLPK